jgi:putative ABC transport system permease protein
MEIFMVGPRWRKVLSDLWSNKTRTLLVALSIAVGVFAVGMIAESRVRLLRGLSEQYMAGKPFSFVISTVEPFDDDLVDVIEKMDGVAAAEGRRSVSVRLNVGPDQWENMQLAAIRDFDTMGLSTFQLEEGQWPPPDKTMLIERSALNPMIGVDIQIGSKLLIETLDQTQREIPIVGSVHDLNVAPTFIFNTYYGYINDETLDWLGVSRDFNSVSVRVDQERFFDAAFVDRVAREVRDKVERSGREVDQIFIPPEPGESPIATFGLKPITFLLSAMSVLAVLLSGFLVTNTISGLLTQQTRQIGVMKSIGGRTEQIAFMYLVLVLGFGIIALLIAAPLAYWAAGLFTGFFATLFNFDARTYGLIPHVIGLQFLVSLAVPLLAAIYPLLRGSRITIREALNSDAGPGSYGTSRLDRLIKRVRGLPRPLLLSLRNTFRKKGRLTLTLVTLTLGGAIFIGVFSVQDSVRRSLDELFASLVRFDVFVSFDEPYRIERIQQEAFQVPGVVEAETWGSVSARRLRPDDTESDLISLQAPPPDTELVAPDVVAGRWLRPEDENALVVSLGVIDDEPDIAVGDTVTLKFKGRESDWVLVGIIKAFGNDDLTAYANYAYFAREARESGLAGEVRIITTRHSGAFQDEIAQNLEEHFRNVGLNVVRSTTATREFDTILGQFNIIVYCLLIMAVLTAVVGGLGLMGTMSMNVLERTREIGVMRAIGASDGSVLRIVVLEGMLIGGIGWSLGLLLALPISRVLSDQVGMLFLGAPLSYTYSTTGALIWLGLSVSLAGLASFLPAWNASRLTVRDVLAYE